MVDCKKNKKMKKTLLILTILILFFTATSFVKAASASLYLSPPSGTYTIDSTFLVKVRVNSGGEAINAAEGTLIFNPDEISIVKLSKSNSIFSLWTTEPTFSNSTGNIVFGGGTPSTFTGTSGTIITITFKAKASASTQISFSSGSILVADGKGTNILGTMNGGVYTLKSKIITPPADGEEYIPPITPSGAPATPVISSTTHPDPEEWYSNNNPEFFWKLPSDITGVSLMLHKSPTGNPGPVSDGLMESKKFEDVEDGIWYFHIKFKNQYGWGGILHQKVLIDTKPPELFEITIDNGEDPTNPTPILYFKTTDSLSGIEYYEVKIGEAEPIPITVAYLKENPYQISPQLPRKHTIIVKAVDAADNPTLATTDVTIEPIEKPVITDFPKTVRAGDVLTIKGTSLYPDATITVFVKKEGEEARVKNVKTDSEGNWLFIYDKSLEKGTYQVWAVVTDSREAKSNPTEKITLAVTLPTLLKFGKIAIDYLSVMITLVVLIVVLIAIGFYAWYRVSLWRKRLRKETGEVEESVKQAFKTLREKIEKQVEYLDKKPGLTKGEQEIRDKLQEALNTSEEFISKEIKDVEKELE